jgi:hypothetical protein
MNPVDFIAHLRSVLGPTQVLGADLAAHGGSISATC